jgi:recombinational DNA repair protein RecR
MEFADLQALKAQYKPNQIKILFIADGIPVKDRYFYLKNSNMYKAVKEAFTRVFGDFNSDDEFLAFFKEMGAYFENLSTVLIKTLPPTEQRKARQEGVQPLAERMSKIQPRLIIISLKVIEKYAREAIKLADIKSVEHIAVTPFPVKSMTNVNNCINGIVNALQSVDWEK